MSSLKFKKLASNAWAYKKTLKSGVTRSLGMTHPNSSTICKEFVHGQAWFKNTPQKIKMQYFSTLPRDETYEDQILQELDQLPTYNEAEIQNELDTLEPEILSHLNKPGSKIDITSPGEPQTPKPSTPKNHPEDSIHATIKGPFFQDKILKYFHQDTAKISLTLKKLSQKTGPSPQGTYNLFFDGASKGNPGNSGAGFAVYDANGTKCADFYVCCGWATCNEAEYVGVLTGLMICAMAGIKRVHVFGDSKLIISQLAGTWRAKDTKMFKMRE